MITVRERLAALREKMADYKMDMYLIGSEDFHGSGICRRTFQVPCFYFRFYRFGGYSPCDQRFCRTLDGRKIFFFRQRHSLWIQGLNCSRWAMKAYRLLKNISCHTLEKDRALVFDGRTVNARNGQEYVRKLSEKGASVNGRYDLVNEIWTERPELSAEPAWLLDIAYAGQSREDKNCHHSSGDGREERTGLC